MYKYTKDRQKKETGNEVRLEKSKYFQQKQDLCLRLALDYHVCL